MTICPLSGMVWAAVRAAVRTFRRNRLRTLLTVGATALGAAAVTIMVSLASSGTRAVSAGVDAIGGRHLIFISERAPRDAKITVYDRGLTRDDARSLAGRIPGIQDVSFVSSAENIEIEGGGARAAIDVAVGAAFQALTQQVVLAGDRVQDDANAGGARRAVLGDSIATELFGAPQAAVGRRVVLLGRRYTVVGVSARQAMMGFRIGGVRPERTVFLSSSDSPFGEGVATSGTLVLRDDGHTPHDAALRIASAILLQRHRGMDDFELMDLGLLQAKWDDVFLGLEVLTGLVAAVSLVIAGAGIMNVSLASVRQRVAEIGIRRALGASMADVRRQFVIEALLLSGAGGALGGAVGLAVAYVAGVAAAARVPGWSPVPSMGALGAAVTCALLVGWAFGAVPARRASRLDIVECLAARKS